MAAVDVSVVSLVLNEFGPEFSVVEAKYVTTAIFVDVAVLVCTVFNFVAFLAAVGVMITPAVSAPLSIVTDSLSQRDDTTTRLYRDGWHRRSKGSDSDLSAGQGRPLSVCYTWFEMMTVLLVVRMVVEAMIQFCTTRKNLKMHVVLRTYYHLL